MLPFALMVFQGLSSGDVERDAQPLRSLVTIGLPVLLAQNFDAVRISPTDLVRPLTGVDDGPTRG